MLFLNQVHVVVVVVAVLPLASSYPDTALARLLWRVRLDHEQERMGSRRVEMTTSTSTIGSEGLNRSGFYLPRNEKEKEGSDFDKFFSGDDLIEEESREHANQHFMPERRRSPKFIGSQAPWTAYFH